MPMSVLPSKEINVFGPVWMDSAHEMLAFNHMIPFVITPTRSFCCTAHGQLLMCHSHCYMIISDWPHICLEEEVLDGVVIFCDTLFVK
jgi:hypothetical protein